MNKPKKVTTYLLFVTTHTFDVSPAFADNPVLALMLAHLKSSTTAMHTLTEEQGKAALALVSPAKKKGVA